MIQRHLGARVSLLPLLVGTYAPDALTKWVVYGIEIGGIRLAASGDRTHKSLSEQRV